MIEILKKIFVCSQLTPTSTSSFVDNIKRAREFCYFLITKNLNPFAPHLFYTQFLDDNQPTDREIGIKLGIDFLLVCDAVHVLMVNGYISNGMDREIRVAKDNKIPIIYYNYVEGQFILDEVTK